MLQSQSQSDGHELEYEWGQLGPLEKFFRTLAMMPHEDTLRRLSRRKWPSDTESSGSLPQTPQFPQLRDTNSAVYNPSSSCIMLELLQLPETDCEWTLSFALGDENDLQGNVATSEHGSEYIKHQSNDTIHTSGVLNM